MYVYGYTDSKREICLEALGDGAFKVGDVEFHALHFRILERRHL